MGDPDRLTIEGESHKFNVYKLIIILNFVNFKEWNGDDRSTDIPGSKGGGFDVARAWVAGGAIACGRQEI